jgi:predicted GNAT superfamily acetyltransferase
MASASFTIRQATTMPDFERVVALQLAIWGMDPLVAMPAIAMRVAVHNGGVTLVAEVDGALVGFAFAMPARRGADWLLWSDMAGVLPAHRGAGVGAALKAAQRDWARAAGYPAIGWTFDPLQRGNANFNFNRLGAVGIAYHPAYYGAMTDAINYGLATDRLEARWSTTEAPADVAIPADVVPLVDHRGNLLPAEAGAPACSIAIPRDLAALKQSDLPRAQAWQGALRRTMMDTLRAGYCVRAFVDDAAGARYILAPPLMGRTAPLR